VSEQWPLPNAVRVPIAIHTGEADLRLADYYASAVNRCALLRVIANGGKSYLPVSLQTWSEKLPPGGGCATLGAHRLRDLPNEYPPLASMSAVRHNLPIQPTSFVGQCSCLQFVWRFVLKLLKVTDRAPCLTG
jgi:hypothetical protein